MINYKTDAEIDTMRLAGKLAARLLEETEKLIKPGISTEDINTFVHDFTLRNGGISAPLNYRGFPKSVCTSVNEVICHGIPSESVVLKDGDIINVDVTPIVQGFHGDASKTFYVGEVPQKTKLLVECARKSLALGIAAVKNGGYVGDIGYAIETFAKKQGFSVVRDYVGHGIGRVFHEEPNIPHFGARGRGERIRPGMVFTIEPMINEGTWKTKTLGDKWTVVTEDGKLSAQFEHTIAVRKNGQVEILTQL